MAVYKKCYCTIDDKRLEFAVIISKANGKWVFCKHKERAVCVYSVKGKTRVNERTDKESFGMLFVADIFSFEEIHSEIEKIILCDEPVENWTYPFIQPELMKEAEKRGYL